MPLLIYMFGHPHWFIPLNHFSMCDSKTNVSEWLASGLQWDKQKNREKHFETLIVTGHHNVQECDNFSTYSLLFYSTIISVLENLGENRNWSFTTDSLRNISLNNVAVQKIVSVLKCTCDFVFIEYGGSGDCLWKKSLLLIVPKGREHAGPHGVVLGLVKRQKGQGKKHGPELSLLFTQEGMGEAEQALWASLW